jgi:hypothetical protein
MVGVATKSLHREKLLPKSDAEKCAAENKERPYNALGIEGAAENLPVIRRCVGSLVR